MSDTAKAKTDELLAALTAAREECDYRKTLYANPLSGHEAAAAYHQSFGYWAGIAKAVEILTRDAS